MSAQVTLAGGSTARPGVQTCSAQLDLHMLLCQAREAKRCACQLCATHLLDSISPGRHADA